MNSLNDIWQIILQQLSGTLSATAVNLWFSDCEPMDLTDNQFVLKATTDFKRSQILGRYSDLLRGILRDLFSSDIELLILVGEEVDEYQTQEEKNDTLPEAMAYTFDRFIVGKSNDFAYAAAKSVAENPGGKQNNPLFIYGPSGLGKTHLMLAIGHDIREKKPGVNVVYITGEEFANQIIQAIRNQTTEEFRQRYRPVELLLIDDIQFIAGRQSVQEEFFNTFNAVYDAGHQIVITSDRPPMEMTLLEDRLRTRFEWGLMADISAPDFDTRVAIILDKAQGLALSLPNDVVNYIADKITANVRQLEGVIHKLTAYSQLEHEINIDTVKRAIKDVIRTGVYIPTPKVIIEETCRYFNVGETEIRGDSRAKDTALARQISMYLMRKLTNLSLVEIGGQLNRNHSTVLSSIHKIEDLIKSDKSAANAIRDISANINSQNPSGGGA